MPVVRQVVTEGSGSAGVGGGVSASAVTGPVVSETASVASSSSSEPTMAQLYAMIQKIEAREFAKVQGKDRPREKKFDRKKEGQQGGNRWGNQANQPKKDWSKHVCELCDKQGHGPARCPDLLGSIAAMRQAKPNGAAPANPPQE